MAHTRPRLPKQMVTPAVEVVTVPPKEDYRDFPPKDIRFGGCFLYGCASMREERPFSQYFYEYF
jgi:hypothetical protein